MVWPALVYWRNIRYIARLTSYTSTFATSLLLADLSLYAYYLGASARPRFFTLFRDYLSTFLTQWHLSSTHWPLALQQFHRCQHSAVDYHDGEGPDSPLAAQRTTTCTRWHYPYPLLRCPLCTCPQSQPCHVHVLTHSEALRPSADEQSRYTP